MDNMEWHAASCFQVSNTYQEINMVVHEFVKHAVSDEERQPRLFNQ